MTMHLDVDVTMQGGGAATTRTQNPPATRNPATPEDMRQAARELREAFRNGNFQQISSAQERAAQAAERAAQATQDAQGVPTTPTPPSGPRSIVIRGPNGTETVVGVAPNAFRDVIPREAVDISVAFFITLAAIIIGLPLARAFARRMDRRSAPGQVPAEVAAQLAQLNQAVDAIALEVERISEGQRFTTRILSEQRDARLPAPAER